MDRLTVFENEETGGSRRREESCNEEFYNLYASPNVTKVIK
jgi:hypothetical protein